MFIAYYFITQPWLFMFAYCPPGVLCNQLIEGSGLFSGDFIIPIISYEEGVIREAKYLDYTYRVGAALFLIILMGLNKYYKTLRRLYNENKE